MEIPCRGQTRGTRARYTRKLYSSEDTPASLPGSHQRGALQEDIGRHSGVVRRRCRGAGLGCRESLVAEALREGDDSTESRWRSLAEARPEAREPIHLASALSEILDDYKHDPSKFEGSIQRNWTSRAPPTHSR